MTVLGILLAQRVRRDPLQLTLWIAGTALLALAGSVGIAESYATVDDRRSILAAALANPVVLMFRGLPSGTSEGAFLAFEMLAWIAMLPAFMSAFLAVRHSRADEESGRAELIAATRASRVLPTVATIVHGVAANVVAGAAVAVTLAASGHDAAGSALLGAAAGATGVVFLGIGLMAAQLMRTSRAANALTVWVLVAAFLVRGLGNAAGTPSDDLTRLDSSGMVWLSPFGWAEQTRPFDSGSWWPVALGVGAGLALATTAAVLQGGRDMGSSFVAVRPGRADARPALISAQALVWRLSAASIAGWMIGGVLIGLLATTLSGVVDRVAGENPAVSDVLEQIARGGSLDEAVITVFFTMLGIVAACCGVQTVIRARQEETRGTAEPVRAMPVGRVRWLADYLTVATCAVALLALAAVGAASAGIAWSDGDTTLYGVVAITGAGQAVAATVFTALTAVAFVALPRAVVALGWVLVVAAAVLGLFGPLLGLPQWTADVSPFAVTPLVDGEEVDLRGLWWLLLVIAIAGGTALTLMRRRELAERG